MISKKIAVLSASITLSNCIVGIDGSTEAEHKETDTRLKAKIGSIEAEVFFKFLLYNQRKSPARLVETDSLAWPTI